MILIIDRNIILVHTSSFFFFLHFLYFYIYILWTRLFQLRSRVVNESIFGEGLCTLIFRTIFFTWLPECIKKIAHLLCGSVLSWKWISYHLRIILLFVYWLAYSALKDKGLVLLIWECVIDTRHTFILFCLSNFAHRQVVTVAKMLFYYVSL